MPTWLLAVLAALSIAAPGSARAAAPGGAERAAGCDIHWQITPRWDTTPHRLDVAMRFRDAGRTRSVLKLPGEWAGVEDYAEQIQNLRTEAPDQGIETIQDKPAERSVLHPADAEVSLLFEVVSPVAEPDRAAWKTHTHAYRTLLGEGWFQFFGHGVLPMLAERENRSDLALCIGFDGLPSDSIIASGHGLQRGSQALWRWRGTAESARHAVYIGGRLQLRERVVEGRPVAVVLPPSSPWAFGIDAFGDAVARLVGAQRRFWHDRDFPWLLVTLQANHLPRGSYGGTAVHQAFAMHAADDFGVPGPQFDHLIGHEHLHTWIPMRFGPMEYVGREDEALRYWFSEGFTDYYTHRLLVQSGWWTLADYAQALNDKIARYLASPARNAPNTRVAAEFFTNGDIAALPYQRGEFLALRWHGLLRTQAGSPGHPGLDAVMRSLLLARDKARPSAPLSQPLATHRLIAALRPVIGERPLADVMHIVEAGADFPFGPETLGPCFTLQRSEQPRFDLGFDKGSLKQRVASGVAPDGPAHAAGLRDGMKLGAFDIRPGDISREVELTVLAEADPPRVLRYRPLSTRLYEALRYQPIAAGLDDANCKAWMGLGPDADAPPPIKAKAKAKPGKKSKPKKRLRTAQR